jgi:hypothetical protein
MGSAFARGAVVGARVLEVGRAPPTRRGLAKHMPIIPGRGSVGSLWQRHDAARNALSEVAQADPGGYPPLWSTAGAA